MNAPSLYANLPMSATQTLRLYLLEAWYELLRMARTPAFVIPTLAFPVVFYLLFAVLIPGQWGGFQKATYLFSTYGVFGVIGPALFGFGVGMAMERETGLLELKRVSPMPIAAYFAAKIAMSLIAALCVVLLLSAAAIGLGDVRMAFVDWALLLGALLLGALPFCALGLWIGSLVKGQAAVGIVNLVYLPMSVLSGLWMPLFVFPELVQKLAVVWPAWHLAQLALGISGQLEGVNAPLHSAVLIGFTVFFLALAAIRLRGR
ncbi:MAG: ABC transporter permease [Aquimonas sp.]|nr:ABC transporter permease [Aquimonas sp.]